MRAGREERNPTWRRHAIFAAVVVVLTVAAAGTPSAQAQTYTILHTFTGTPDGDEPLAGLATDSGGNLYGTTYYGGAYGWGMVFKLARTGSGWQMEPLHSFPSIYNGGNDGAHPSTHVTLGPDGAVYGTTPEGAGNAGIVFKLTPPPSACETALCPWNESVLYSFPGSGDGPGSPVIFDQVGNLYGVAGGGSPGCGVVYELSPSGSGWSETVLYEFAGPPDGCTPTWGGLTFDEAGNLYGTTSYGGYTGGSCPTRGCGTVFRLTPSQSGWAESVLYSFQGLSDGDIPSGGVILDNSGNLYGATPYGGNDNDGTIYGLTPSDGNWTFNLLYTFDEGGIGGPVDTLTWDSAGNLLGTTFSGGSQGCFGYGCGNVFKLARSSAGWSYSVLHQFLGNEGGNPEGSVIVDAANGNIYGTASIGGSENYGVVFEITP